MIFKFTWQREGGRNKEFAMVKERINCRDNWRGKEAGINGIHSFKDWYTHVGCKKKCSTSSSIGSLWARTRYGLGKRNVCGPKSGFNWAYEIGKSSKVSIQASGQKLLEITQVEKKVPAVSDPSSLSHCLLVLDGSRIFGLVSDDDWRSSVAFSLCQ